MTTPNFFELECYAPGPFTAGAPVSLIDSYSLEFEVLPANGLVMMVSAQADQPFSGSGNFSIGWNGSNGAIVGPASGLTADGLNASNWVTSLQGFSAPTQDQNLTVMCDSTISGQIHFKIVYTLFSDE
jgi:hypothetical protein